MREFTTAVIAAEETAEERKEAGWIEFQVHETDREGKILRTVACSACRPSPGQVAYVTAAMHRKASKDQQIAGAITFCMEIMDHDTRAYLSERLLDSEDPFELKEIQEIIEGLIEEWSGKATEQSSDSSDTPQSSGSASMASV